jgi:putative chitinase
MALTLPQLVRLAPHVPQAKLAEYLGPLNDAMHQADISTSLPRMEMFLATILHESGGLKFFREIWGPTPAQQRYEGRHDLGNTQPGDGFRFRGRGVIQITGRANYRRFGPLVGADLEGNPDLAAAPEWAFKIAATFWTTHHLNHRADEGDFEGVTRAVNGGLNGWEQRRLLLRRVKVVLGNV